MSDIEPGTVMYKLTGKGWVTRNTVERLTPTGIVVLSNGTRLNPSSFGQYQERGASMWEAARWYPEDNERVTKARAYNRERAYRDDVDRAYEAWRKDRGNRQLASVLTERAAVLADREPFDG